MLSDDEDDEVEDQSPGSVLMTTKRKHRTTTNGEHPKQELKSLTSARDLSESKLIPAQRDILRIIGQHLKNLGLM
jgi:hypothetical protein